MSSVKKVIALVEGETEAEFVHHVVAPYLQSFGVFIRAVKGGDPKRTQHGGVRPWGSECKDICNYLKSGKTVTTLFDFYGLKNNWPGRVDAERQSWSSRGESVESAIHQDVCERMSGSFDRARFMPCIQVHEFESLLFVKPDITASSLALISERMETQEVFIRDKLNEVLADFSGDAEAINDSPLTAPSKRIGSIVAGYDKRAWGYQIVKDVSLSDLRIGCQWLDRWLTRLENLG